METIGKRWSTQVRTPLSGPMPVTGGLFIAAMASGSLRRIRADHDHGFGLEVVRRDHEVLRRGRALEDAAGEVEARAVAGAVVAARPGGSHVGVGPDLLLEVGRAAQVRA